MNRPLAIARCSAPPGSRLRKDAVQLLPLAARPSARILSSTTAWATEPQVNFYANETKMTAVSSATGTESTQRRGVRRVGRRPDSALEPGAYTLTDGSRDDHKNLAIDTLSATIARRSSTPST